MTKPTFRAALLCACAFGISVPAQAKNAAGSVATASDAAEAEDQSTTANQAGQANDKNSLTSADIIVTGSRIAETAPITSSLATTQPQSAVSREYIDNANANADFNMLILLTPGVSISGSGNGQGFAETKAVIRGFQDGEYNITYDSIPFADTNNPTHHSTAFFPSNTIETVVVDRGPGNASQLGQATYGGNVNMYSLAADDKESVQLQGIAGNWNTFGARFEYQTGKQDSMGGAKLVIAGQYMESDGALTWSPVQTMNIYAKAVIPIGSAHTLTAMTTWNKNHYYQSDVLKGATCGSLTKGWTDTSVTPNVTFANAAIDGSGQPLKQLTGENCAAISDIGIYGRDYQLTNDPARADYWKYNLTEKHTDFSYLRLQSDFGGGFSMDNRGYTYAYTNNTLSGNGGGAVNTLPGVTPVTLSSTRPVTGFSGAGTAASPYVAVQGPAGNVLGYDKLNKYRVYGYIGQINYEFALGKIRLGGWWEHADTDRHLFNFDWTAGKTPSYTEKFNNGNGTAAQNALPSIAIANIRYDQESSWNQYQLFSEFEFRPVDSLSITPGYKYVHFTRAIDAKVNQTSRFPLTTSATWTKSLPFLTVNWQAQPNWSFYAQFAQGFYVPDLSSFYSASGALSTALDALKPMSTTNYQIGTVYHGAKFSVDLDAYMINVNNKIGQCNTVGCDTTLLVNIGQVRYKGVEGMVSYMPVDGLTVFANGSYNYAHSVTTGAQIAKAPLATAAAGFAYRKGGLRVSFSQKLTGVQYANEFNGNPVQRLYRIAPYSTGEFAISQEVGERFRIGLQVSNVFNSRAITAISTSSSGAPTVTVNGVTYQNGYGQSDAFNFLPPRSATVDVRVKF